MPPESTALGRWVIYWSDEPTGEWVIEGDVFLGRKPVPVVPVDEPAVERAARAINALLAEGGAFVTGSMLAECALRAAGEET